MATFLFTVTFQGISLLPRDTMVNTWYFEGSGTDTDNVEDMLMDFYDKAPAGGGAQISGNFSTQSITDLVVIRSYNLSEPKPRAPHSTATRSLANLGTGECLPNEVSLVMSYRAEYESGVRAARRRGRIYLPPMIEAANTLGRPSGSILNLVGRAARDLLAASNASASWEWVQYSETTGESHEVVAGWVDNAWDTQRRRGVDPTTRTPWTATTPV